MKKVIIFSTGLLLGFLVFLIGFPSTATTQPTAPTLPSATTLHVPKTYIRECTQTCLDSLDPRDRRNAEVLLVLGQGNRVVIYEITPNGVSVDPAYDSEVPGHLPVGGSRMSNMTYTFASPGCVTINGRNYCW